MGTFSPDNPHPTDSTIYWRGCDMCTTKITKGTLRKGKRKKDPKRDCKTIEDQANWVTYLEQTIAGRTRKTFDAEEIRILKNIKFTQGDVCSNIIDMITDPNQV